MNIEDIRDIAPFSFMTSETQEAMIQKARITELKKGQVLFIHEENADNFYLIDQGWIKLFRETFDGDQAVVDIMTNGHMFGDTSIFQEDIYPYSAEAAEPSRVIAFPIALLKKEIELNPKLAMNMLTSMARYRRQQDEELEHRTIQNAPQRIGCFLLKLTDQHQVGPVKIHLPYDKVLVASRLGMQPETFSRALKKLKNETGINISGSTIEIESLAQLSTYSCAACSSEFPCKDISLQDS